MLDYNADFHSDRLIDTSFLDLLHFGKANFERM